MIPPAHHINAEHRHRQIALALRHVCFGTNQRPRSSLLLRSKEGDLKTVGQLRVRQNPRQLQRHGHTRGIVVRANAACAALCVIVGANQYTLGVQCIAPNADNIAGDSALSR